MMDEYQTELNNREALHKRMVELERQVAALTIRAPVAGRLQTTGLSSLTGQYLESGTPLLALGEEARKELIVSVSQHNIDAFTTQPAMPVSARILGRSGTIAADRPVRVGPRATTRLPHQAMGAAAGGPPAVRAVGGAPGTRSNEPPDYVLLEPRFTARLALPEQRAAGLRAGEIASVAFGGGGTSCGRRLHDALRDWIDAKLAPR